MSLTLATPPDQDTIRPPVAKIVPSAVTVHGDTRIDNYAWLRDREDPDTIRYLEAENAYTKARMQHAEALESRLYAEMLGRIKQTDLSVPVKRDDYFYYTRTEEGKQYSIYCRKRGSLEAPEQVLLDANVLAEGMKFFNLGIFAPSCDHRLLAYSVDYSGDEVFTVRFKDLESGTLLPDQISNTAYSFEWADDNRTVFYTVLDEARRPYKAFRHVLGVDGDPEIFHEQDRRFEVELTKTSSRAYILLNCVSPLTTEVHRLEAGKPGEDLRVILPRQTGTEYDVTHHGESFFIRTNDNARTFRLVQAPVADPSKPNWVEVLPAREGVTVESVTAF